MERKWFSPDPGSLLAGAIMIAIGAGVTMVSLGYGIGTVRRMDTGFYPMLLGIAAMLLGATIVAVDGLRGRAPAERETAPPAEDGDDAWPWAKARATVLVPLSIALFALLLERAGLLAATFVMVVVSGLAAARPRLRRLTLIALATPAGVWAIFVLGFGLPFKLY
ncbi:MAG: tripartite tricarboxylate transporter TctB family protein [Tropicimonas sp.]|uniref:tripartite tricarboxylate transporter TctB family protein n=1 Tax=Tropicimonas sp. TaxID=2067044 RepID=UPI003A857AE0